VKLTSLNSRSSQLLLFPIYIFLLDRLFLWSSISSTGKSFQRKKVEQFDIFLKSSWNLQSFTSLHLVCDFYANKICGISFLKFTLLDWRSAPFSICEVRFFIWLNDHHSTHKQHCNELWVLAAGSYDCHCKSCSSLREAAEHKCTKRIKVRRWRAHFS
jgi:hypothetical protein